MPSRRSDVLEAARGLLGAPFRHQGRDRSGIDCIGLIIAVGRAIGVGDRWPELPYHRFPPEAFVREILGCYLEPLGGAPEPGDVALIRWRRTANHLAIVTDGSDPFGLLHAYYVTGTVVEHRADHHWRDRIVALYGYRGIAN